jgi:hypothetical protein
LPGPLCAPQRILSDLSAGATTMQSRALTGAIWYGTGHTFTQLETHSSHTRILDVSTINGNFWPTIIYIPETAEQIWWIQRTARRCCVSANVSFYTYIFTRYFYAPKILNFHHTLCTGKVYTSYFPYL